MLFLMLDVSETIANRSKLFLLDYQHFMQGADSNPFQFLVL